MRAHPVVVGPDGDLVAAGLGEIGRPLEHAGDRVQKRTGRHIRAAEGDGITIPVNRVKVNAHRVTFAHRARRHAGQLRRCIGRQHGDLKRGLGGQPAIAGQQAHIAVNAGLAKAGQPLDHPADRVEHHARWQMVKCQADGIAVGIGGVKRDAQQLTFAQRVAGLQAGDLR